MMNTLRFEDEQGNLVTAKTDLGELGICALFDILSEHDFAKRKYPPFNSAHEGFAVLLEEVDELKKNVWMRQDRRDLIAMRNEAKQVAAMALRFMLEVCGEDTGRR